MNRDNEPTNPMTAENVEQFDVWIFDSSELVVSVIPIDAPWNAKAERYALTEQARQGSRVRPGRGSPRAHERPLDNRTRGLFE
jgi:hypothetical protein